MPWHLPLRGQDRLPELAELRGVRHRELQRLPREGVEKPEMERVEQKAGNRRGLRLFSSAQSDLPRPSVHVIPDDRTGEVGAVQPDLMRSARLQPELEEGESSERLKAPVPGDRDPPGPFAGLADAFALPRTSCARGTRGNLGKDRHLLPVHGMSADPRPY